MLDSCNVFSKKMSGLSPAPLDIPPDRCYCSGGAKGRCQGLRTPKKFVHTKRITWIASVPRPPIARCMLSLCLRPFCSSALFGESRELADTADLHGRESSRMPHCQYDRSPARGRNRAESVRGGGKS